jgi:cytochrome c oxidase cbb3-type subunit 3
MPPTATRCIGLLLASALGVCAAQPTIPNTGDSARDPVHAAYPIGPVPGPAASSAGKATNPHTGDAQATSDGRQLFVRFNCSGCHGGRGGGGMAPSLRDEQWLYGSDDADIFDSIAQGRGRGMPAWRTRVNPDDIWRLVTYIKSLRTDQEPKAPR